MATVPPELIAALDLVNEEDEKFKRALGLFVMMYADAEAELYRALKHYAQVSDGVARAIFSGNRAGPMMAHIRAIVHNLKTDEIRVNDLEFVFAQMADINTARDEVVHFSSAITTHYDEPSTRLISNAQRVRREGNHFTKRYGSAHLAAMTQDLVLIVNHLQRHWSVPGSAFSPFQRVPGELTTWRYRPEQPNAKNPPSKARRKRERPPKSSA